eukprot:6188648-Pleurochrysis_carterae.AAC.1
MSQEASQTSLCSLTRLLLSQLYIQDEVTATHLYAVRSESPDSTAVVDLSRTTDVMRKRNPRSCETEDAPRG